MTESSRIPESSVPKAVALISGGLDSMLAAKVISDHGCHVEGINFYTGFCVEGHTHAIRKRDSQKVKRNNALWVAERIGIRLHMVDIVEEYKDILINPRHGYGANLNPCLDCKCFMVKKAHQWMLENNFDFIVTGEVVGQRPKSQRRDTMPVVARESGAESLLLRPLCAKHLPPTHPETLGWVDREKLYDFSGRSRKPQMALAAHFGFEDYAQPAGGCCFLTDARYSAKLADLWASRGHRDYDLDDIILLKIGRHLRPRPHFKLIIAREEGETNFLAGFRRRFLHLESISHTGPLCLVDGQVTDMDVQLAARLTARFGKGRRAEQVEIRAIRTDGTSQSLTVRPMGVDEVPVDWYL